MLWYFFSRAKQIKEKAEKERKRKRLKATYLAHLAQQRRPSPKGQGRILHQARQAGSSPPAAAWLPGSCLAAPRPPFSVVETPVFIPFLIPPLEPSSPSLLCVPAKTERTAELTVVRHRGHWPSPVTSSCPGCAYTSSSSSSPSN